MTTTNRKIRQLLSGASAKETDAWRRLGRTLRERRLEIGHSLEAIAKGAGIGSTRLVQIESGGRPPTDAELERIAIGYGIGTDSLLELARKLRLGAEVQS